MMELTENKISINPGMYIGLGNTGIKVMLEVKCLYLKKYGEIPPNISFLCIDSDLISLNENFVELSYYQE